MSVFQTLLNVVKVNTYRKSLNLCVPARKCIRKSSDVAKKFISFDEVAEQRRAEAKRSIVVQVSSEKSYSELYGYCSKYASINGMHHYKNSEDEHFILIEFTTEECLKEVIRACSTHQKDLDVMALQSPFLWFKACPDKKSNYKPPEGISLVTEDANITVDEDTLYESLMNCNTVSEQIQTLYDTTALNDLGVRLRYIVARQVENLLESMYSDIVVRPFGSTVNGFGKLGCDLDLVLTNVVTDDMDEERGAREGSRRLVFQQKRCERAAQAQAQAQTRGWARHVELVAAALELRAAGAARVARVPLARVPIVQCAHRYAHLDVDICFNNMSGVYMSELLWRLGGMDPRVRPLVFAVRCWAQTVGITNPHPGRWITNFPLTLLVLHFLQQTQGGALLPPVTTLMRSARPGADVRVAAEGAGAGEGEGGAHADLHTLLLQFYEFYAQFDFQEKAISLNEGKALRKPSAHPLYIVNPLETTLNVSKNVSYEECERLKAEVRNAAWQLEGGGGAGGEGWGLLGVVERRAARDLKRLLRVGNSHRLVSVKDLFKEDDVPPRERAGQGEGLKEKLKRLTLKDVKKADFESAVNEMKAQLESAKGKKEPLKFKNSQIASEVFRIRRNKLV